VAQQEGLSLRRVDVMVISPTKSIEEIAAQHLSELPRTVRFLLRGTGAMSRRGANLASYLLFEKGFCQELIALGYRDTMDRVQEVNTFFEDGAS
jgi:NTE family protein